MYSCIIVEDEPIFAEQIRNYLARTTLFDTPMVFQTAMEAFAYLSTTSTDVIFLDFHLPDMTGLDMLQILPKTIPVIMTTVDIEQAAHCYDRDEVIDFLLKPYEYSRFLRAVRRALAKNLQPTPIDSMPTPVSVPVADNKNFIYFKSGRNLSRFVLNDILYAEAYGAYVKVYTLKGTFAISQRMSSMNTHLPADRFVRVHKSYIVNIQHLTQLEANHLSIVGSKIPIGITFRPAVMQFMKEAGILNAIN